MSGPAYKVGDQLVDRDGIEWSIGQPLYDPDESEEDRKWKYILWSRELESRMHDEGTVTAHYREKNGGDPLVKAYEFLVHTQTTGVPRADGNPVEYKFKARIEPNTCILETSEGQRCYVSIEERSRGRTAHQRHVVTPKLARLPSSGRTSIGILPMYEEGSPLSGPL